jgi:hypothetical protein
MGEEQQHGQQEAVGSGQWAVGSGQWAIFVASFVASFVDPEYGQKPGINAQRPTLNAQRPTLNVPPTPNAQR